MATSEKSGKKPDKKKKSKAGKAVVKHNWEQIRSLFVEGVPTDVSKPDGSRDWLTLKEIASRSTPSYEVIRQRAAKERWTELRTEYQAKLAIQRQKERAKRLSHEATEFDDRGLAASKLGMQLITARLGEIAQEVRDKAEIRKRAIDNRARGHQVDYHDLLSAINYKEIEGLGNALSRFQEIGMKSLGTDVQRHEITGADGGAIEATVSVKTELARDDQGRLAGVMAVFERSGALQELIAATVEGDVVDGEVVDEEEQPPEEYVDQGEDEEEV